MASFKRKGMTVSDGDVVTLVLAIGSEHSREITGTVSSHKDDQRKVRWEISTESWDAYEHGRWPAVGFLLEDIIEIRSA